jgi:hypothetical protein
VNVRRENNYRVCIQSLEQINNLLEEVTHFLVISVIGIAARLNGVNAGSVRVPLMSPEIIRGLVIAEPVNVHIIEQLGTTLVFEDDLDIGDFAGGVAILTVVTITVVRPFSWICQ